ncbi:hypothetical protein MAUB_03940 [Mycolicibacterium aubagnense]|uniref:Secreted protein n=1 Tax=Mycolicibacterium aubagnense TaxID=319707 RepID=A0ABN5YLF2_9MYCO|nr:hypothetical protein MAUB_03940 [Mycolicibacterium aubagnense]
MPLAVLGYALTSGVSSAVSTKQVLSSRHGDDDLASGRERRGTTPLAHNQTRRSGACAAQLTAMTGLPVRFY